MSADAPTGRSFTWERAPFSRCAECGRNTFGFLSGGGHSIQWRCSECRYQVDEPLPEIDKEVIYFDQFAFSELFKLKAGTRRDDKLTPFWKEVDELIHKVVHLQQAVLPHSDIHSSETIVSPWPVALREAYEAIGGDLSFEDSNDIQMREIEAFAHAFVNGGEPSINFEVDEIIRGHRNEWLPNLRIVVNADYSQFAEGTRKGRDGSAASMTNLMNGWRDRNLGFNEVLNIEQDAYFDSRAGALRDHQLRYEKAEAEGDLMALMNLAHSHIMREMRSLHHIFKQAGIPEGDHVAAIAKFWSWDRTREMPFGRILAYLFAALAGQVKAGRKKPASPGFMNDVQAIAAYAPFVDAMFLDKECATLLTQGRPRSELDYRARIFSLNNKDEFLDYLRELEARATDEIRHYASIIYGLQ